MTKCNQCDDGTLPCSCNKAQLPTPHPQPSLIGRLKFQRKSALEKLADIDEAMRLLADNPDLEKAFLRLKELDERW